MEQSDIFWHMRDELRKASLAPAGATKLRHLERANMYSRMAFQVVNAAARQPSQPGTPAHYKDEEADAIRRLS